MVTPDRFRERVHGVESWGENIGNGLDRAPDDTPTATLREKWGVEMGGIGMRTKWD